MSAWWFNYLSLLQITKFELACLSGWMYTVHAFPGLPYLAYITLDLNPADWAALVAQLAEHWTSNPVVTGSNPVRGSSVFFFTVCLRTMPYLVLPSFAYTCTRFDHVHLCVKLHTSLDCEQLNVLVYVLDCHPLHVVVSPSDISQTWHWSGADLQCHHHQNTMVCTCSKSTVWLWLHVHVHVYVHTVCIYLHLLTCSLTLFVLLNVLALFAYIPSSASCSPSLHPCLTLFFLSPSPPLSLPPSLDCPLSLSLLHSLTHSLCPSILTLSFPHSQSVWSKRPSSEDAAIS